MSEEDNDEIDEDPDASDQDWSDEPDLAVCPHCRKMISEEAERCPHCGNYISADDEPISKRAWIILAVIIALLLALLIFH